MVLTQGRKRILAFFSAGVLLTAVGCGTQGGGGSAQGGTGTSGGTAPAAQAVNLQETGSTLLYPLFQQWAPAYQKLHANVTITPAGTGSGTGIADASNGTVQIGASDAYMSKTQLAAAPGILNIPLAISAQNVMYNIPGMSQSTHLNLSGPMLADIFTGKITKWNDPLIAQANPGVTLPNATIVPVHRTDGSGDTFIFSQYLSFSNPSTWGSASGPQFGTTINWPNVTGGLGGPGNQGVVQVMAQTKYSVGYVGVSWQTQALQAGLGMAALKNAAGNYVLSTHANVAAAANQMIGKTPTDERISLIFAPGANSYPIINYEYAIVNQKQASPAVASAMKQFFTWAISPTGGNAPSYIQSVHFLPLPSSIAPKSQAQIAKISG